MSLSFVHSAPRLSVRFRGTLFLRGKSLKRTLCAMTARRSNILVTWDIDGTLMGGPGKKRDNSAHKVALEHAMHAVWGIDGKVNQVPHAGCTDRGIVRDVCRICNVADDDILRGMDECILLSSSFINNTIEDDISDIVLPGVPQALSALNARGAYCGLVTGNFQEIGWTKLQRAGIRHHFELGAFGSDCFDRNDILSLALKRAEEKGFRKEFDYSGSVTNVYHVGDAIADMRAARHVGGRGIGVLTGAFGTDDLKSMEPYVILNDLSDTRHFLRIVGLDH